MALFPQDIVFVMLGLAEFRYMLPPLFDAELSLIVLFMISAGARKQ
jgi:hypothetical protein